MRERFERLVAEVTELSGPTPARLWGFFAQGACCSTSPSRWTSRRSPTELPSGHRRHARRLARLIDRRRRAVLPSRCSSCCRRGVCGPVVGLLDVGDDFSDPRSESIQARDTVERTTGRSAAPDPVVLVRLGARVDEPQAAGWRPSGRRSARTTHVAEVVAPEPGRPSPADLRGPPVDLSARDLLHRGRRRRGGRGAGGARARRAGP